MVFMKCIVSFAVACVFIAFASALVRPKAGGLSIEKPANKMIEELVDDVRDAAEARAKQEFEQFRAIRYREQVVAGMVYYVKVQVATGQAIHIKIYKPLGNAAAELRGLKVGKTMGDKITYFD